MMDYFKSRNEESYIFLYILSITGGDIVMVQHDVQRFK